MPNWFHVSHFHSDQSPVNMEEITLTFLSDACSDYYTDNTISSFRNKLSSPLQLSRGEWEIALTSVSYTGSHYINNERIDCLEFSGFKKDGTYEPHYTHFMNVPHKTPEHLFNEPDPAGKGLYERDMKIKTNAFGKYEITRTSRTPYYNFINGFDYMFGFWESKRLEGAKRLFDVMIRSRKDAFNFKDVPHYQMFLDYAKKDIFMYHHYLSDRTITILVKGISKSPEGRILTVGQDVKLDVLLADLSLERNQLIVSYDSKMCFDTQVGLHVPDLLMGRSKLLIYCDLIPPQYVGGTVAPLLRMIPSQEGRITEHFSSPTYFKLNRDYIDDFHIYIKNENGNPPSFERGTFSGTLSLRKRA